MSELVALTEEKKFKPRPQNKFLVSLRDSLQNFPRDPRPFYFGVIPGHSCPQGYVFFFE